jgi:uncharacterized membrane protein YbhN (UPF0104 family)
MKEKVYDMPAEAVMERRNSAVDEVESESPRRSRAWGTALRLGVTATLVAVLAWRLDWRGMWQELRQARWELCLAACFVYVAAQVVSGYRWKLLARPLGFDAPWSEFTRFYFIGMFFNMFLPTSVGGDVVRALYLDARPGRRLKAFLSVLVDRASGLLVLLLIACVAMSLCRIRLPEWVGSVVWGTASAGVMGVLLLWQLPRWQVGPGRLRRLVESSNIYFSQPGLIVGTTLLSVLIQAANVILVWLLGSAMGTPVPGSYYWIMVPMVTVLTLLPSIGGIGLREWGMFVFLAPFDIPQKSAVGLAVLWFLVLIVAGLVGGLIYLLGSNVQAEVQAES